LLQLRPLLLAAVALSMASCGGGGDAPDGQERANPPAAQITKARLIVRGDAICKRDMARLTARLARVPAPKRSAGISLVAPYLELNEQAIRSGARKIAALGRPSSDAGLLETYLDERTTAANALRVAIAAAKKNDIPGFEAALGTYGHNAAQAAAVRFGFEVCGLGAGRVER
jgi:hypothetical protein